MKTFNYLFLLFVMGLGITACNPDGDIITTQVTDSITLSGSGDVVLSKDNLSDIALTLQWTDNSTLTLNASDMQAPLYATVNTLQFSASEGFDQVIEQPTDKGVTSMMFTVDELNSIAGRVGLESGETSPMYIRVSSVLAANMPTRYSNIYKVDVTPYKIDMSRAFVLNSNGEDTGWILGSTDSNGIYCGFLGVTSWFNYWLLEGNGIMWGNDAVSGTPFLMSSDDGHWNFWFPGVEGCYYTVVNTLRQEWSALHVSALHVSGDIQGDMIYNRKENKWSLTFNAIKTGNAVIQISGEAEQYNINTGTDDVAAVSTAVSFGQNGNQLTWDDTSNITISIPVEGEATLTLDLSDPFNWNCFVTSGGVTEEPSVAAELWAVGIDDGITGSWNFDQRLPLINEDELTYAGVCQINSLWGYRLYPEKDNWGATYGFDWGDATFGGLAEGSDNNIPGTEPGLYLLEVSLSEMTYKTTAVQSVQITGVSDNWALMPMNATDIPGVYTIDIDVTATTPWGFQIILNENWDINFGGTTEQLIYKGGNIALDDSYIGKVCTFTVDLCKGTVIIEN